MAETASPTLRDRETNPIWLKWVRDGNDEVPRLSVSDDYPQQATILEYFDAETVEELTDELTNGRIDTRRLGILVGGDDGEFYSEADLLALVEDMDDDLAENMVEEVGDIPTICEERRRDGDVFLGGLTNDLEVEGADWVGDLSEFIGTFGEWDSLEKRMKNANVWVEPDNVTAEGY